MSPEWYPVRRSRVTSEERFSKTVVDPSLRPGGETVDDYHTFPFVERDGFPVSVDYLFETGLRQTALKVRLKRAHFPIVLF